VKSSLSISPCNDHELTLSTAHTECSIYRVQHTPSTAFTEYSMHRVLHTPSTAYTEYCIISRLTVSRSQPVSSLGGPYCTQRSTFPRLRVNQWIEFQLPSHLPPDLPPPDRPPPSTAPISIHHGLHVRLQTRPITASRCISELHDLSFQMHLQTNSITASKWIPGSQDLVLQDHLQTRSIRPPCASLSYSITASKCISKLA